MNEDDRADGVNVTSVDGAESPGEGKAFIAEATPSSEYDKERKAEPIHLKTKPIPAIVTLLGGGIVTADVFLQQLEFRNSLIIILISLIVFLFAGEIVKLLLDRIELPNPEAVDADGNVIQKGKSGDNELNEEGSEGTGIAAENSGE